MSFVSRRNASSDPPSGVIKGRNNHGVSLFMCKLKLHSSTAAAAGPKNGYVPSMSHKTLPALE
jgi:hypothetical protein